MRNLGEKESESSCGTFPSDAHPGPFLFFQKSLGPAAPEGRPSATYDKQTTD